MKYVDAKRIREMPSLLAILTLGLCLLVLIVSGCIRKQAGAEAADTSQSNTEEPQGTNLIAVDDPSRFPLVAVEARQVRSQLQANGVVAPDVNLTVPVLSLAGGRAIDVRTRLGDYVAKGQVLLRINSPDVSQALSDYQKAVADEVVAHKQLDRSRDLYEKGAIAERELEEVRDSEDKTLVDVRNTEEHLRILGSDVSHPSPVVEVRAPIAGVIVEQNVAGGAAVRSLDNSPNLFTIADLSRVWVLCDVYENDLAQVHLSDYADVRLNAYPDRLLRGRVGNISQVLDSNTRAAKVRLELENPGGPRGLMRAGMFATATFYSARRQTRAFIPTSAILRLHDRDWVFRPQGGRSFEQLVIQGGEATHDGMQEVLGGLAPGDKVVANALEFSSAVAQQ